MKSILPLLLTAKHQVSAVASSICALIGFGSFFFAVATFNDLSPATAFDAAMLGGLICAVVRLAVFCLANDGQRGVHEVAGILLLLLLANAATNVAVVCVFAGATAVIALWGINRYWSGALNLPRLARFPA